jgi:cytochrome P450
MKTVELDDVRASTPDIIEDPYPYYRVLRKRAPVYRETETGAYLVSRFADVQRIFGDPERFSNIDHIRRPVKRGPVDIPGQGHGVAITQDDEPYHGRVRRPVNRAFTPRMVVGLSPVIERIADDQLAQISDGEPFDVASELGVPVPIRVMAHVLGVPQEMTPTFKRWSHAVVADPSVPMDFRRAETEAFMEYFAEVLDARRTDRHDDMVSKLIGAQEESGESSPDQEILAICHVLLVAGNETTTGLITAMLKLLSERPEAWARLRADRSLVEVAVEEALRFESPVQSLGRRNHDDVTVAGTTIPADSQIRILVASANRDEEVFSKGDDFHIGRDVRELRRHIAFGHGIHFCLGAPLSRAEAAIVLNKLLDRFGAIRPAGRAELVPAGMFSTRAYRTVPLVGTP